MVTCMREIMGVSAACDGTEDSRYGKEEHPGG
jgi:hypothetical protein